MNRNVTALLLLVCLTACGANTESGNPTGGKTNWLSNCDEDRDCSELPNALCADQKCTKVCAEDAECSGLGVDAACGEVENESDTRERVCVATSDTEENCDAALCAGDETESDTEVGGESNSDVIDSDVTDVETMDSVESQESGTELDSDATNSETAATEEETQTELALDCVGPTNNVEQAYECSLEPCACAEPSSEIVCSTGADGTRYAFQCDGEFWLPMDNSRCATDATRCFSPTENVELALSGTLPGCECSPDDFTCAIQGDLRVPMECGGENRWRAMPDGADCGGLFMDLCAFGPSTLCETSEQNGTDDIRFFLSSGGGFVDEFYPFYGAYGYSFLAIDGSCNYWVGSRPLGLVRTGTLDEARVQEVQSSLHFGELVTFAGYQDLGCDDGGTTVLRDSSGQVTCSCGCDDEGAPPGFVEAFSAAVALRGELFAEGTDVTGPAHLLILEDETLEPLGSGVPWQAALDPLANLFVYESEGGSQVTPYSGHWILAQEDLEALRAMRQNWLSTNEYSIYRSDSIHATVSAADAGAPTHLKVFLRDDIPDPVRAEFGLATSDP